MCQKATPVLVSQIDQFTPYKVKNSKINKFIQKNRYVMPSAVLSDAGGIQKGSNATPLTWHAMHRIRLIGNSLMKNHEQVSVCQERLI